MCSPVGFLCPLSANVYGIEFDNFIVKNGNTNQVVFKVSRPPNAGAMEFPPGFDMDLLRQVRYRFPISFLDCSQVNTSYVTPLLIFIITSVLLLRRSRSLFSRGFL